MPPHFSVSHLTIKLTDLDRGTNCAHFGNFRDPLQENRSMATKPFRHTKVSISSRDVLGDEIVY